MQQPETRGSGSLSAGRCAGSESERDSPAGDPSRGNDTGSAAVRISGSSPMITHRAGRLQSKADCSPLARTWAVERGCAMIRKRAELTAVQSGACLLGEPQHADAAPPCRETRTYNSSVPYNEWRRQKVTREKRRKAAQRASSDDGPRVSAARARRCPIGCGDPMVVSLRVCRSASAFISAPRSTT